MKNTFDTPNQDTTVNDRINNMILICFNPHNIVDRFVFIVQTNKATASVGCFFFSVVRSFFVLSDGGGDIRLGGNFDYFLF